MVVYTTAKAGTLYEDSLAMFTTSTGGICRHHACFGLHGLQQHMEQLTRLTWHRPRVEGSIAQRAPQLIPEVLFQV